MMTLCYSYIPSVLFVEARRCCCCCNAKWWRWFVLNCRLQATHWKYLRSIQ